MSMLQRQTQFIDREFAPFPLRIGRSRIQGYGVFAAGRIPKGRKVIEYTGELLPVQKANARLRRLLRPGGPRQIYMLRLNRYWRIDGAVGGCGAERINHSCDPNLLPRKIRGRVLFFSRRSIHTGEELSLDYRLPPKALRIRCRCGASKCRGFLNVK